jgi:hypothetical protein
MPARQRAGQRGCQREWDFTDSGRELSGPDTPRGVSHAPSNLMSRTNEMMSLFHTIGLSRKIVSPCRNLGRGFSVAFKVSIFRC